MSKQEEKTRKEIPTMVGKGDLRQKLYTKRRGQPVHVLEVRMLWERVLQQDEFNWMPGIFEYVQRRFKQSTRIELVTTTKEK